MSPDMKATLVRNAYRAHYGRDTKLSQSDLVAIHDEASVSAQPNGPALNKACADMARATERLPARLRLP